MENITANLLYLVGYQNVMYLTMDTYPRLYGSFLHTNLQTGKLQYISVCRYRSYATKIPHKSAER
jgi:hypothetical protein